MDQHQKVFLNRTAFIVQMFHYNKERNMYNAIFFQIISFCWKSILKELHCLFNKLPCYLS